MFSFDGSFQSDCQKDAVPPSLLALANMILDQISNTKQSRQKQPPQVQLFQFPSCLFSTVSNMQGKSQQAQCTTTSAGKSLFPCSLPVMKIHAAARSRGLLDTLHSLGMCVSYDRLLQSSSDVRNGIYQRFLIKDAVYPSKLRQNLFNTAAVDNNDHNQSSATAIDSFHRTGISVNVIENPSHTRGGLDCGVAVLNQDRSSKSTAHLPSTYTSVPPVALRTKNFNVLVVQGPVRLTNFLATAAAEKKEDGWLNLVKAAIKKQAVDKWISWSVYHANAYHAIIQPPEIHTLLPLFTESPHSTVMLRPWISPKQQFSTVPEPWANTRPNS